MAKTEEKHEDVPAPEVSGETPTQPAQQPQRVQVEIDDSKVMALYANFCRVTGTPEELIIDFGLNPQPFGIPQHPIAVTQRIITNFYTAKRMLHALQLTIQRHIRSARDRRAEAGENTSYAATEPAACIS